MKNVIMALIASVLAAQAQAKPHTLTCENQYAKSGAAPVLTATISSDTTLRDIKFNSPEDLQDELKNAPSVSTGTMVVSNHSPYKGDIQYNLPNGVTLLLPASLSNDDLEETLKDGIGYGKNENGVVIGYYHSGDSDGGNHFSIRMNCSSDK